MTFSTLPRPIAELYGLTIARRAEPRMIEQWHPLAGAIVSAFTFGVYGHGMPPGISVRRSGDLETARKDPLAPPRRWRCGTSDRAVRLRARGWHSWSRAAVRSAGVCADPHRAGIATGSCAMGRGSDPPSRALRTSLLGWAATTHDVHSLRGLDLAERAILSRRRHRRSRCTPRRMLSSIDEGL